MLRLAWFSPLPPTKSGIARYNRELLPELASAYQIDVYVEEDIDRIEIPEGLRAYNAFDFAWRHHQHTYDLIVYQLGNAQCHDYMWAYLFRYPGLVVLHDGQLHHARGRMLLQQWRPRVDDYRQELWFNHPDARKDVAELGVNGLLGSLTYLWPMLRSVVVTGRRILVHNAWLADELRAVDANAPVAVVDMGVPPSRPKPDARVRIRQRHRIPHEAVVFTALGRVTPEKRIREAMRALASLGDSASSPYLLLAGEPVDYYDMASEAQSLGIAARVIVAGYVDDDEVDDYLEASDVCLCMRWPTARETSAAWLRCLAAARPTISTDLAHTVDIPTLDPRNWSLLNAGASAQSSDAGVMGPVGASIDILDEDHSLKLAVRRFATDRKLRDALGASAKGLWHRRFSLSAMADGYAAAIAEAMVTPAPARVDEAELPGHLRASGLEQADEIVRNITGSNKPLVNFPW